MPYVLMDDILYLRYDIRSTYIKIFLPSVAHWCMLMIIRYALAFNRVFCLVQPTLVRHFPIMIVHLMQTPPRRRCKCDGHFNHV